MNDARRAASAPVGLIVCAWVSVLLATSCSRVAPTHDPVTEPLSARAAGRDTHVAPLAHVASSGEPDAGHAVVAQAAGGSATDASAPDIASTQRFKTVLLAGDSMVGVRCCLSKALETRFNAEGARFFSDAWSNVTTATYDHDGRFAGLVRRINPDLVIVSLGTNDVFVPHPEALASNIASIVKKVGARACYWIGPPTWKGDTGIVEVIRKSAAPCKFFDSSAMPLERIRDGVHVTDSGGADWASRFWSAFRPVALPAATP